MLENTHSPLDCRPPRVHHLVGLPFFGSHLCGPWICIWLEKRPTTSCCARSLSPFCVCALGFCQLPPQDNGKPRRSGGSRERSGKEPASQRVNKKLSSSKFCLVFPRSDLPFLILRIHSSIASLFYGASEDSDSDSDSDSAAAASAFLSLQLFVGFPLFTLVSGWPGWPGCSGWPGWHRVLLGLSCGTAFRFCFYLHTICQFMAVKSWPWFRPHRGVYRHTYTSPAPALRKYMLFVFIDFQVKTLLRLASAPS